MGRNKIGNKMSALQPSILRPHEASANVSTRVAATTYNRADKVVVCLNAQLGPVQHSRLMLSLLLLIPVIGSILILPIQDDSTALSQQRMKQIALSFSILNFILSVYLWVQFDSSYTNYQFVNEFTEINYLQFNLGVDGLSIFFVILTALVTPIAILSNYNTIKKNLKYYLISFLLLETLQMAVFVVLDLIMFYVFFESVLPILFIIIIAYGSGSNKERSALLFFLYTLAGSLFMLLAILELYSYIGSTDFQLLGIVLSASVLKLDYQTILWLSLSFSKRYLTNRLIIPSINTLNNKNIFAFHSMQQQQLTTECKSLVLYGSNLGSTLKYEGFSSKLRQVCHIPVHLRSVILGVLLSDGWLYKNKSSKTLLALKQKDFEYLWFVYTKLFHYCRSLPKLTKTNINGKVFTAVMFATRVYPCFTEWYNIFYDDEGKKKVPLELYNMLTYEALAHWIMGDGTRVNKGLTLQTQSVTVQECVFIISILIYKYDLKCSIHMQRNQPTIYISSKSMKKLRPLILPFMCTSMKYKLGDFAANLQQSY